MGEGLAQSTTFKYLALGDSYTIGESVTEPERWPNQLATLLSSGGVEIKVSFIATTGWRTDNLIHAIDMAKVKEEFDLVSLLIGVNNQYQGKSSDQYAIEFEELLKISIRLARGERENVFVVSIPDYGFTPFGQKNQSGISREIDLFNEVNEKITNQYHIKYFNITNISRRGISEPSLVAADGLHPSGKMYALWVQQMAKEITLK